MSFSTISAILGSDVATDGTFSVSYPSGTRRGDFINGVAHKLLVNQRLYEAPTDFTVSFGASTATLTWKGETTLTAGAQVRVQFDKPGSEEVKGVNNAAILTVVQVDLGNPATSDDDALRASAAWTGGATALTLIEAGQTFDVPRNVIITSSGDDSGKTFAVVGEDEYGEEVRETITGANAGVAAGKKAFKTITSVTPSANAAANVKVGFGDVLGLPVWCPGSVAVIGEMQDGAAATAGTLVAGLSPLTAATATNADVRGTYDPNAACDGSKSFSLLLALADPAFKGVPQYAG